MQVQIDCARFSPQRHQSWRIDHTPTSGRVKEAPRDRSEPLLRLRLGSPSQGRPLERFGHEPIASSVYRPPDSPLGAKLLDESARDAVTLGGLGCRYVFARHGGKSTRDSSSRAWTNQTQIDGKITMRQPTNAP
jgi:hypothetical protein